MARTVRAIGIERFELERLRDQVGRLFATLSELTDPDVPPAPGEWSPPFDLCESKNEIVVIVDLPGVESDSIELRLTPERLTITGEKRKGARGEVRSHLCSERNFGRFRRTVNLRWPVIVSESTASLRDGILTVRLPRLVETKPEEYKVPVKII